MSQAASVTSETGTPLNLFDVSKVINSSAETLSRKSRGYKSIVHKYNRQKAELISMKEKLHQYEDNLSQKLTKIQSEKEEFKSKFQENYRSLSSEIKTYTRKLAVLESASIENKESLSHSSDSIQSLNDSLLVTKGRIFALSQKIAVSASSSPGFEPDFEAARSYQSSRRELMRFENSLEFQEAVNGDLCARIKELRKQREAAESEAIEMKGNINEIANEKRKEENRAAEEASASEKAAETVIAKRSLLLKEVRRRKSALRGLAKQIESIKESSKMISELAKKKEAGFQVIAKEAWSLREKLQIAKSNAKMKDERLKTSSERKRKAEECFVEVNSELKAVIRDISEAKSKLRREQFWIKTTQMFMPEFIDTYARLRKAQDIEEGLIRTLVEIKSSEALKTKAPEDTELLRPEADGAEGIMEQLNAFKKSNESLKEQIQKMEQIREIGNEIRRAQKRILQRRQSIASKKPKTKAMKLDGLVKFATRAEDELRNWKLISSERSALEFLKAWKLDIDLASKDFGTEA